jgi:hypothetical protein
VGAAIVQPGPSSFAAVNRSRLAPDALGENTMEPVSKASSAALPVPPSTLFSDISAGQIRPGEAQLAGDGGILAKGRA